MRKTGRGLFDTCNPLFPELMKKQPPPKGQVPYLTQSLSTRPPGLSSPRSLRPGTFPYLHHSGLSLPPTPCFPNCSAAQGLPSESNGWAVGTARAWVWRRDLGTLSGLCKGSWCCWRPGKCAVNFRLQVVPQPHRTPPSAELCPGGPGKLQLGRS